MFEETSTMKPSSSSLSKPMKKTSKRSKLSKSAAASSSSSAATSLQSSSQHQQQQATLTTTTAHQEAATPTLIQDLPKEKAQHRSYAGFGPKSIKMIWEQHDTSDTEVTMEAYTGLAEDTTYKVWETINTIKTYARHSGGSVTCELVSEVLKDSNCPPSIGAGESEWDKIEYDGTYFYNTDRVVELRDQYINEIDGFKVYETDVVSTWNADKTKLRTFVEFVTCLCNTIFLGNGKSYIYGLDIAANASQVGCTLKLILRKCNEILAYQQKFEIIERCLNFLKALSYNPYARHVECYEQLHKLSELLICLLMGTDEEAKSPPEVIFKIEKLKKVEKKVKIKVKKIDKNKEKLEKKRRSLEIVRRYLENQRQVNQQKINQQLLIQQQNILRQNMLKLNPQTFRKTYGAYLQVLAARNAAILKGRKLQQRGNQNNLRHQNHSSGTGTGTATVASSSGINLREATITKRASRILRALKLAIAQKRLMNQQSSASSSTPQKQIMGPPPTPSSSQKQVMGPPPPPPLKRQIMGPPLPPSPRRQVMGPPPPPPPQVMGPPPPPSKRKIMGPPPQPPPKIVGPRSTPSQVMGPPPSPLQKKIMGPPPQPIPKIVGPRISPLQLKRTLLLQSQIMNSPSLKKKVLGSASASQIKAMAASLALSRSLSQSLLGVSSTSPTVKIPITSLKSPNDIKIEPGTQQQKQGQILPPLSLLPSSSSASPQLTPSTVTIKVEKPDNDENHDQNQHQQQQQQPAEKPNEQNQQNPISTLPFYQTKICDFKNVDLIVSTIGCIGGQFGYFHNACIYLIQKKMVLFFEDRDSISCDTDFYFISRFVRGLIALGGYAFREIIQFLDRIDPLNAPEWLCSDFNVAATFLKGRDDIFLYEWLEDLCGDKLQPFLVYSFKYHHNLMIKLHKNLKKPEFEIKPKIILRKFEKKIQNDNDKNIIKIYFPEMINFDINKLTKTVFLISSDKKINFKPGKKYIEKTNEEEKKKKLISLTDRSVINNKIIIGKRRIMKKLTSNKKKIVNLSNYCYLQI